MDLAIKLIVLLPLLAAVIAGLFGRIIGDRRRRSSPAPRC